MKSIIISKTERKRSDLSSRRVEEREIYTLLRERKSHQLNLRRRQRGGLPRRAQGNRGCHDRGDRFPGQRWWWWLRLRTLLEIIIFREKSRSCATLLFARRTTFSSAARDKLRGIKCAVSFARQQHRRIRPRHYYVMRVCISAKRVRCSNEGFWDERMCCTYTKEKRRNLRESGGRSLNPRLFEGLSFFFWLFRVLEKISVFATCVIVSKKDANFSASERGIYTRDVIRSERYTNDRERRKRGRSGRHRGGTVHSFYFYC